MSELIHIDGSQGGGQILRSSLSLAMLTGKGFRIKNIRGQRRKPGLQRQHLTCVQAAVAVCNGSADGVHLGADELIFCPGEITAGDYEFSIGSAGSTSLVLQTLLPALLMADSVSSLRLHGGTHNPMAPPFEFLARVFLPQLRKMGVSCELELVKPGFAPAGGGELHLKLSPWKKRNQLHLRDRGAQQAKRVAVYAAHLPASVCRRELKTSLKCLAWPEDCGQVVEMDDSSCSGNVLAVEFESEHVTERVSAFGSYSRSAESVAKKAAKQMNDYLSSEAVVGKFLADQLLLPMAMAGGGSLITLAASNHLRTNAKVIEAFLPMKVGIEELDGGRCLVRVVG
ncbi:RNA 3'-terminal phosphate cyclase [Persicirhabdus sediminis]|uniref:RNA 3'-terminal phosphate cyclase n=1 Tax=Persicirhabdus sediminis TaxID=454144 RepID=A0A8J7MDR8_9BACT|nr:RNA 3'-terminal phosphate cyclase [Persicirhabdus sediminis]MBK1790816.1 RNA 3'-terminal phosphate cyclase [Persicirhabdus sediminis]